MKRLPCFALLVCAACSGSTSDPILAPGDSQGSNANGGGSGGGSGGSGSGSGGSGLALGGSGSDAGAPASSGGSDGTLVATIRDFKLYDANDPTTNPDFEHVPPGGNGPWEDRGIVAGALGADGKPVYAHAGGTTLTTHGQSSFDQWYRDVAGTNVHVDYPIVLAPNADGSWGYDSEKVGVPLSSSDPTKMFFPIDDGTKYATPFGNQGDPHNYSFTVELHTVFTYKGGEYFQFRGDDDVFVYVAGKLVIDLGGIHAAEPANVKADDLGLTKGEVYPLDFFSAERHKTGSNILFTTTLALRPAPPK